MGEISFFFNTKRTASIVNADNNRLFFLNKLNIHQLQKMCPRITHQLQNLIYQYQDHRLLSKVKMLKDSVYYFKNVEYKALIELAL